MSDKTYDDGVIKGRMDAIEKFVGSNTKRLDHHSRRLTVLERVMYMTFGAVMFLQLLPVLKAAVGFLSASTG